jgi:glycosyltransferase involved in cell wall biosynthesis
LSPEPTTRKWCINGRFLTQPATGVQRYAHEIVRALDQHLLDGHPYARGLSVELIAPRHCPHLPALRSIRTRSVGAVGGHAWEQTVLPTQARTGLLSLCNSGPLVLHKHIVCIHDANTRAYPGSYSLPFRTLYRWLLPALGRTAARIATVSHYSAGELVRYGITTRDKIMIAPDGHEHALRWTSAHSPATRTAAGPNTVVILGSPAPHKNVGLIIGMANKLAAAGLSVAVAGISDSRVFKNNTFKADAPNVFWLGRLSDEELAALLKDSLCLAFPSLAEGFGLPALEAMTLQCPVVASDRASLPEICADAALYAPPFDGDAWLASFLRLREDAKLRQTLLARGQSRSAFYSWSKSAEAYLDAMAHADATSAAEANRAARP